MKRGQSASRIKMPPRKNLPAGTRPDPRLQGVPLAVRPQSDQGSAGSNPRSRRMATHSFTLKLFLPRIGSRDKHGVSLSFIEPR